MPQSLLYDSVDEANNRLASTYVTYEGEPVFVQTAQNHADGCIRLMIVPFPFTGSATRKRIDSPAFNRFRPVPLGFCNDFRNGTRHTTWCERTTPRTRRQGLCSENFRGMRNGSRIRFDHIDGSDGMREMIVGEYPTFDQALALLADDTSMAVHREFALVKNGPIPILRHKTTDVGLVFRDQLYLDSAHQYLLEMLLESPQFPNRVEIL